MKVHVYVIILLVLALVDITYSLRCLDCKGLLSPLLCQRLIWCPSNEICVLEKIHTFNGEILYNVGCSPQDVCQNMTTTHPYSQSATDPRHGHGSAITDHMDSIVCRSCCQHDACNLLGCGVTDSPSVRGPLCYTCPQTVNPDHCSSVSVCNTGEECHIHDESRFGIFYYSMSCKSKFDCDSISGSPFGRRRRSTQMSKCCSSDLCNINGTDYTLTTRGEQHTFYTHTTAHTHTSPTTGHTSTTSESGFKAFDCRELKEHGHTSSGVYTIHPDGQSVKVYCDMVTAGGGWTVITNRINDSLAFNRSWSEFARGFGNVSGSYWIGNRLIHTLTAGWNREVYFSLQFTGGKWEHAQYKNFSVASESEKFRISYNGPSYTGNAGNAMYGSEEQRFYAQGMYFTTYDRDNDQYGGNCARDWSGGWWYNYCHQVCLTGKYGTSGYEWHKAGFGHTDYLIASKMMIK